MKNYGNFLPVPFLQFAYKDVCIHIHPEEEKNGIEYTFN